KSLKPGSEEHTNLQRAMIERKSRGDAALEVMKREFERREAKLYAQTYARVRSVTATYARRNGIRVVVQHSSAELDPDEPKTVLNGIKRTIVYQDGVDITDSIIERLKQADAGGEPAL
ncbi:MAG: hypothetical protein KDA41_11450, partial [Planctomycetales bacterium]|nr:hypothetical protein [Planctomycetales bacterium]